MARFCEKRPTLTWTRDTHLDDLRAWRRRRMSPELVEGCHNVAVLPVLLAGQEDQAVLVVRHRCVLNLKDTSMFWIQINCIWNVYLLALFGSESKVFIVNLEKIF